MLCVALHACFFLFGAPPDYARLLDAVQIPMVERIEDATAIVVPAGATGVDTAAIVARVDSGALLVTEGDSPLSRALGLSFNASSIEVTQVEDASSPKLAIVWEKPLKLVPPSVPPGAKVTVKDKWTGAPLAMVFPHGRGRVFFLAAPLSGYARFPYFIQTLIAECGVTPPFRASRLHAFFDYGYRTGVDVDYFAKRWRRDGVMALHASAWQFWDRNSDRDQYLHTLIAACHREGVLVYAWLELPHVSDKFWQDHPEWREKTAALADAHLDWRGLINLLDPNAFQAVARDLNKLLGDFDWDGVNLSELYYESPQGPENPQRFTPMNDVVRADFRKQSGIDPVEFFDPSSPHHYLKDAANWKKFVDYRVGRVRSLDELMLHEIHRARLTKPYLHAILTSVDNLYETRMREALGVDVTLLRPASAFTLVVEDPASMWSLGPERYSVLGEKYGAQTAGIDINVVDRYQDVFPTKRQTGGEFLELFHNAAAAFSPVLVYFEASVLPRDMETVAYALAASARLSGDSVESPRSVWVQTNSTQLDGKPWPARTPAAILVPSGKHTVGAGDAPGFTLTHLSGELLSATYDDPRTISFTYRSDARAIAAFSSFPSSILVDGKAVESLLLPPGEHRVQARQ